MVDLLWFCLARIVVWNILQSDKIEFNDIKFHSNSIKVNLYTINLSQF